MKTIVITLASLLALASCRSPLQSELAGIHAIDPATTGAGISNDYGRHYAAVNTGVSATGYLVVMLPGTGGSTANYQKFLKVALDLGHHALSLAYPNTTAVGTLAGNDLDAYDLIRQEICTGTDSTAAIAIDTANSIENRLTQVLLALAADYPTEGWNTYVDGSGPIWSKIMLAGYSQGAGHAAYLASQHAVARYICLSGVVDGRTSDPRASATWISNYTSWATVRENGRYFVSIHDGYYPSIEANLSTLGLSTSSDAMYANTTAQPITSSRLYLCNEISGDQAHPSTVEDGATPLATDGSPLYRRVWVRLLEP